MLQARKNLRARIVGSPRFNAYPPRKSPPNTRTCEYCSRHPRPWPAACVRRCGSHRYVRIVTAGCDTNDLSVRFNMEVDMRTSTITPPIPKNPKIMIVMHWITLAALVIGVVASYTRGLVECRALRSGVLDLHRSCELVVLVTVTLRMAFYFYARRRVQHDLPASLKFIGVINHLALYLLMFTLPIIGCVLPNARGQTFEFFGLALPTLMSRDRDLADVLGT